MILGTVLAGITAVLLWGLGIVTAGIDVSLWFNKAWWIVHVSSPVLQACAYIAFASLLVGLFLLFFKGARLISASASYCRFSLSLTLGFC